MTAHREIPFRTHFIPQLRAGSKTATARSQRYGVAGDVLLVPGASDLRLRLTTDPVHIPLRAIAAHWWREEGAASPQDFERIWASIHPRTGWTPGRLAWLHRFEVLPQHATETSRTALEAPAGRMLTAEEAAADPQEAP